MALLKLLLSLGTIIAVIASSTFENSKKDLSTAINNRLSDNIKPIHYNIEFILNIEEGIYYGKSNVSIKISKETEQIELHSMNLAITKSTLIYKDVQQSEENKEWLYKPSYYSYDKETNIFIIHFSDKLLAGNYIINMEFFGEATNDTEGFFRTSYDNGGGRKVWLVATHLQTIGARQLFPCWDEPEFKATFTISIKHLTKYIAFSNMPVKNLQKVESNMMWTHFHTTPIMPPNFMAIAVIDFVGVSHNWNVKIWHKKKEIYQATIPYIFYHIYFFTHLLTLTLENEWHMLSMKMTPKVDYIVIPDFPKKVAITWGLILYREDYIIDKEISLNITYDKINALRFIAYNMAQESLNNIPPWLSEGFARLLEIHIIDKNLDDRMMDMLVVQIQHESFRLNSYFNETLLEINNSEVNSLPSSFRYHKAFPLLRMLQHLLTDEVFREGIKNYLDTNMNNRTALNDFWIAMQDALDKSNNEKKINLIEKMDGWIKQKNYPILQVKRDYDGNINVLLQNFNSFGSELWIPITYTTQNNPDFNKISLRDVKWLKFIKESLFSAVTTFFGNNEWLIINLQQTGYYRVNYDTSNWKKIAKYLNSIEYMKIHVLNRAQIIDDAFYFLTTNQISPSVFWELINYLERETDYVAWYPMIKVLEHMSSIFLLSDPEIHEIKERMKEIFNKVLENIGYEESYENKNYFTNCLRQEVTKWACLLDEFKCKKAAGSKLQQYLATVSKNSTENSTENKLLPWWEEWTYCNGLMVLDNNYWHNVYSIYMIDFNSKYLKFLACSERIITIQDYGSLILKENGPIKDKDRAISFHYIIAKHAKNNNILDYMLANFEKITLRVPISAVAVITNLINHVYSEEQLKRIYQFISESYMKHIKLHVQDKIKRRLSEITNITNYFQKLFSSKKLKHI